MIDFGANAEELNTRGEPNYSDFASAAPRMAGRASISGRCGSADRSQWHVNLTNDTPVGQTTGALHR